MEANHAASTHTLSFGEVQASCFADSLQYGADRVKAAAFEDAPLGLIVCDRRTSVHHANKSARAELESQIVLGESGGYLRPLGVSGHALRDAIKVAISFARRTLLLLRQGDGSLFVAVNPLTVSEHAEPLALLVLGRREVCSESALGAIGAAYQLTRRECEVLTELVAGSRPNEIADVAGVAISTVRTHISAIRSKLDAPGIRDLLIKAALVPPFCPHQVGD